MPVEEQHGLEQDVETMKSRDNLELPCHMPPCTAPGFDVSSSVVYDCSNVSQMSMAPVMWMPVLVPSNWVSTFPPNPTCMPAVFQYPWCMSQSFVPDPSHDAAQYAQMHSMHANVEDARHMTQLSLQQNQPLSQQWDGQIYGSGPSIATSSSAFAINVRQADDPRRKRSQAGQMHQLVRWRNRLHNRRLQTPPAAMIDGCSSDDVVLPERTEPNNIMQPLPQESSQNVGDPICDGTVSASSEDRTQEVQMRPTYCAALCQGAPWRAVPAKSNMHR